MIYFATDLATKSCAQIVHYIKNNDRPQPSDRRWIGVEFQDNVVKHSSIGNEVYSEMRGFYDHNEHRVYFCIDMVKNGSFYEIKSVTDKEGKATSEYEDWYFNSSILQCALYKTMLLNMTGNTLDTPAFRVEAGFDYNTLEVNKQNPYYLLFGRVGVFRIELTDPNKIIGFINDKIDALKDYKSAYAFDAIWKHKEFELLKDSFTYTKVDEILTDF